MTESTVTEKTNGLAKVGAIGGTSTFQALRFRDYRLMWFGLMGHSFSMWAEMVARSWLIWQITGSGVALGLVNFFRAIPFLIFGLISGVVTDRVDKRLLLVWTQAANAVLSLLLAVLITTGQIEVWHVYVTAFLAGTAMTFNQPTRQALVPALVPAEDVMNAVALSTAAMNTNRIVGPAAAGLLIAVIGLDGVYYADALIYVLVVVATAMMRVPPEEDNGQKESVWQSLSEGFRYIRRSPVILGLLVLALVPMVFGMPYNTLLPVFADSILKVGASGLGLLTSASGVSALVGSLTIASLGSNLRRKGWLLLLGPFLFGAFVVGFAGSTWLPLSFVFISGIGVAQTSYMAINNACLLTFTPPPLRGRVMAVYMLDRGLTPIGAVVVGVLTDVTGAPLALALMGVLCMVLAAAMGVAVPQVRNID